MWRFWIMLVLGATLSACGTSNTAPPTPRPDATPHQTKVAQPVRISLSQPYRSFVKQLCSALSSKDAGKVIKELPYYQYNSGVRYGFFGDGEGHSADPSVLNTWLPADQVRCQYLTGDSAGHGLLLTSGWKQPGGPWNLIEVDTFSGQWKINDFTFANRATLWSAMHISQPIVAYRGQ